MTGSVHAAIGAAIGKQLRSKPLALIIGIGSHVVGDMLPHHDMGAAEAPLVFATLAHIALRHGWNSPAFWAALGAVLPDFEHIPAELKKDPRRSEPMEEKYFPTHNAKLPHLKWPWHINSGIAFNILLFLGGLYLADTLGKPKRG
jgi:hypothetical protein